MMDSTPNSMGGGRLFDLTDGPDFPAPSPGSAPLPTSNGNGANGTNGTHRTNGVAPASIAPDRAPSDDRAAPIHVRGFTPVAKDVATEPVKRFFRALLDGSPARKNAKTVRAAGEWPKMLVDEFFDRMVSPSSYRGASSASAGAVASIQPSEEQAGQGRVTMRDVFSGFIWS